MERKSGDTRAFHLIVGDTLSLIAEVGNFLVDVGHSDVHAQHTPLRTIESVGGNGATAHHIVFRNTVHQFFIGFDNIRHSRLGRVVDKINECFFKTEVGNLITVLIESEYAIKAYRFLAHEEGADWNILLHTATSADTHNFQTAFFGFLGAGGEIDIRQRINLVHHDVAVVGTDAGRDTGYAFAVEFTCNRMKLTALHITFDTAFVEERSHHIYTVLVAYKNDLVG